MRGRTNYPVFVKRAIYSVVALTLILFVGSESASAHARVIFTSPKAGSTITKWPQQLFITFNEPILKIGGAVVDWAYVKDAKGVRFDSDNPAVKGSILSVGLKEKARSGKYTVTYRAVSDDGHPISDSFTFTYRERK